MSFLSWKIGRVTVTKVPEFERIPGMKGLLPDATPEALQEIGWLRPHFVSEKMHMNASIHALIVETPDRRIMVDTCVGNDKERTFEGFARQNNPFLADMAAAGFARESIDTVLCTHLHIDHVGWNTILVDGKWVPTFPGARYLFGRDELDHWQNQGDIDDGLDAAEVLADSVTPILDADLAELVDTEHVVCDEVRLIPTIGHTPGHVSVLIESEGETGLITGDFMHHPCQIARPEWAANVDFDSNQSTATRRAVFERFADTPTLIIGTHFSSPTAGHLVRDGESYRLDVG